MERKWKYGKHVFTSAVLNPPTPIEIARRRFPEVDVWSQARQSMGRAVLQLTGARNEVVWQMVVGCDGIITHWRWHDDDREQRECAEDGLDIRHYPGKWREAQRLAQTASNDNYFLPYWERTRLLFLELGGEFVDRRRA